MKIYAIIKGNYSDYHICRLTTDYKKAKRYKEAYSDKWGEAWIETYEDNEFKKVVDMLAKHKAEQTGL